MKRVSRRRPLLLLVLTSSLTVLSLPALADEEPVLVSEAVEVADEVGGEGFLPEGVERIPTVEEILASDPDNDNYRMSDARNCLPLRMVRRIEPLDRHRALFVTRRGRVYLNDYSSKCDGQILPTYRPSTESRGATSQLCRGDRIDWFDTFNAAFSINVACRIGGFQEITEEQADALKVALDNQRKTDRERRRQKRRDG